MGEGLKYLGPKPEKEKLWLSCSVVDVAEKTQNAGAYECGTLKKKNHKCFIKVGTQTSFSVVSSICMSIFILKKYIRTKVKNNNVKGYFGKENRRCNI